jgi:hypothetical protein
MASSKYSSVCVFFFKDIEFTANLNMESTF